MDGIANISYGIARVINVSRYIKNMCYNITDNIKSYTYAHSVGLNKIESNPQVQKYKSTISIYVVLIVLNAVFTVLT